MAAKTSTMLVPNMQYVCSLCVPSAATKTKSEEKKVTFFLRLSCQTDSLLDFSDIYGVCVYVCGWEGERGRGRGIIGAGPVVLSRLALLMEFLL